MKAIDLAYYLENQEELDFAEFNDLKAVVNQYPYCLALRLLLLKKAQIQHLPSYEKLLNVAATYTPDRKHLYKFVKTTPIRELANTHSEANGEAFDMTEVLETANLEYDALEEIQPAISGFEIFPDSQLETNDTFEFIVHQQPQEEEEEEEEAIEFDTEGSAVFDLSFDETTTKANTGDAIEVAADLVETPLTSPNPEDQLSDSTELEELEKTLGESPEISVEQLVEPPVDFLEETPETSDNPADLLEEAVEGYPEDAVNPIEGIIEEPLSENEEITEEIASPLDFISEPKDIQAETEDKLTQEEPELIENIEPDSAENFIAEVPPNDETTAVPPIDEIELVDPIEVTEETPLETSSEEENLETLPEQEIPTENGIPVDEFNDFLDKLGLKNTSLKEEGLINTKEQEEEAEENIDPLASLDLPEILDDKETTAIEFQQGPILEQGFEIQQEEPAIEANAIEPVDLTPEDSISLKPSEEEPQLEDFIAEELEKEITEETPVEAILPANVLEGTELIETIPDDAPLVEDIQVFQEEVTTEEVAEELEAYTELIEEASIDEPIVEPTITSVEIEKPIPEDPATEEVENEAFLIPSLQEETETSTASDEISFSDWLNGLRPAEEEETALTAEVQEEPIELPAETVPPPPSEELETQGAVQLPQTKVAMDPPSVYRLPGSDDQLPWDAEEFKEPAKKKKKKKPKKKKGKKSIRLLAKASVQDNDEIISEPLAALLAMQGKTKKAIKMYQQLSLKFPEKSTYFAGKLDKLMK